MVAGFVRRRETPRDFIGGKPGLGREQPRAFLDRGMGEEESAPAAPAERNVTQARESRARRRSVTITTLPLTANALASRMRFMGST